LDIVWVFLRKKSMLELIIEQFEACGIPMGCVMLQVEDQPYCLTSRISHTISLWVCKDLRVLGFDLFFLHKSNIFYLIRYVFMSMYIYIYMYVERDRQREREREKEKEKKERERDFSLEKPCGAGHFVSFNAVYHHAKETLSQPTYSKCRSTFRIVWLR